MGLGLERAVPSSRVGIGVRTGSAPLWGWGWGWGWGWVGVGVRVGVGVGVRTSSALLWRALLERAEQARLPRAYDVHGVARVGDGAEGGDSVRDRGEAQLTFAYAVR